MMWVELEARRGRGASAGAAAGRRGVRGGTRARDHVILTPRDRLAYSYTTYEIDTAGITFNKHKISNVKYQRIQINYDSTSGHLDLGIHAYLSIFLGRSKERVVGADLDEVIGIK